LRDVRVDLERIVICAKRVIEYTAGCSFDEFVANDLRYDATLRNLEIMGEAAKPCRRACVRDVRTCRGATSPAFGIGSRMRTMRWMTGLSGTRCDAACRRRWRRFAWPSMSSGDRPARARAD